MDDGQSDDVKLNDSQRTLSIFIISVCVVLLSVLMYLFFFSPVFFDFFGDAINASFENSPITENYKMGIETVADFKVIFNRLMLFAVSFVTALVLLQFSVTIRSKRWKRRMRFSTGLALDLLVCLTMYILGSLVLYTTLNVLQSSLKEHFFFNMIFLMITAVSFVIELILLLILVLLKKSTTNTRVNKR